MSAGSGHRACCDRRRPTGRRNAFQLRRRGVEARIVTGLEQLCIDPVLCRTVARGLAWMDQVRAGISIAAIAHTEDLSQRFIRARLPHALLSAYIVAAIEQGGPPASLTTELLVGTPLPCDGDEQARLLDFESTPRDFPLPTIRLPASPLKLPCKLENLPCSLV